MRDEEGYINLVWDKFQRSIPQNFRKLRLSQEFSDVTLVSEDEIPLQAHRVILASGSLFFQKLLSSVLGNHPHPLLYLRGVTGPELESVLDFLYHGEARVSQGSLKTFLRLAQQLGVKGLMEERLDQAGGVEETVENAQDKNHQNNKEMVDPFLSDDSSGKYGNL